MNKRKQPIHNVIFITGYHRHKPSLQLYNDIQRFANKPIDVGFCFSKLFKFTSCFQKSADNLFYNVSMGMQKMDYFISVHILSDRNPAKTCELLNGNFYFSDPDFTRNITAKMRHLEFTTESPQVEITQILTTLKSIENRVILKLKQAEMALQVQQSQLLTFNLTFRIYTS